MKRKIRASIIMDELCNTAGIVKRKKPGTTILSKEEIIKLYTFVKVLSKPEVKEECEVDTGIFPPVK